MKVGIIGAGFAGVNAAQVIAQAGVEVTLFSAEKVIPYFRPRLPQLAFADEEPDNIFINKLEWYAENGIDLRLNTRVEAFTSDFEVSLKDNGKEKFNALIIATGGRPVIPPFASESSSKNIFTLWNYSDAVEIRKRIKSSKHIAIIGGGTIGVESALRAEDNSSSVTIIEQMPHLMSRYFEGKASEVIEVQLHAKNINFLLNNDVCAIREDYNSKMLTIDLNDKDGFMCYFALIAVGTEFDTSMASAAGLKTDRQIIVDEYLQTSSPGIFAAGDIAQFSMLRPCSAQEASQQGKAAGNNVLAYLSGRQLQPYEIKPVPIHLKYKNFELYSLGEVPKIGEKEENLNSENLKVYRNCVYENSALAGVQIVGKDKNIMQYQKEFFLSKVWKKMRDTKIF